MNLLRPILLLLGTALCGQPDPFALPVEAQSWARRAVLQHQGTKQKLQGILDAVFSAPAPAGLGLGMVYDNSRTRSVEEVWTERRANCLSLTAFFVAACRAAGIEAKYAEPTNTNRWHRVGNLVRLERHVVALVPSPPLDDVVADFLPQLRRRVGVYVVTIHSEARFKALFHSNRAVEMLDAGRQEEALAQANLSVAADASCAVGWNVRGVVHQAMDRDTEAEACFRKAMALDPKDGTPVGNLEQFMRGRGRQDEAQALRTLGGGTAQEGPLLPRLPVRGGHGGGRLGRGPAGDQGGPEAAALRAGIPPGPGPHPPAAGQGRGRGEEPEGGPALVHPQGAGALRRQAGGSGEVASAYWLSSSASRPWASAESGWLSRHSRR